MSDTQPGVIEVEFTDVDGVTHSLIDKLPIFGVPDDLGPDSVYPVPAEIGVDLVERLGDGTVIDLKTEAHNTDRMRFVVPSADISTDQRTPTAVTWSSDGHGPAFAPGIGNRGWSRPARHPV